MASPLSVPHAWNLVAPGYLQHNLDDFEVFARRAIELAGIGPDHRVIDVACGPGSLTLPAAAIARRVEAIDFSGAMVDLLRERLAAAGIDNVGVIEGDGEALPFADASFDAGFSMFGLMFFPDRAKGFAELRRVLRPGARAIVSSWVPMDDIEVLRAMFGALFELAPEIAPGEPPVPAPLSTETSVVDEMAAAGFDVEVRRVDREVVVGSMREMLSASRASFAPLCLIEEQLGKRFDHVWQRVGERLQEELGDGPVSFPMRALFGVGIAR